MLGAAGGVGATAVELGKAMGATVIAAASTDEKLEFAASLGADHGINYTTDDLKQSAKDLTSGVGVDVVGVTACVTGGLADLGISILDE